MSEEKTIVLDLTDCKYFDELHERIRMAFDFPHGYGKNWSAFWDFLRTECDAEMVEIVGESTMPKEFQPHIQKMHEILQRNKMECQEYGWHFDYKIIS